MAGALPGAGRGPADRRRAKPGSTARTISKPREALAALLADHGPKHIVLGILANKDADAIVDVLAPHALSLTFVPVADHAHHDPAELAQRFGGRAAASLKEALADLPAPRLIAGSLYLAGEALRLNNQTSRLTHFLVGMLGADVAAAYRRQRVPIDWSISPARIISQNSMMPGTAAAVVSR